MLLEVGTCLSAIGLFIIYLRWKQGVCKSQKDMTGKTVIITGANKGIGYYTALDLSRRNARVILACRDEVKGQVAAKSIELESGNKVVVKELDISLMKSVRKFAKEILEEETRLDVLVNNAGITLIELERTEEGLEKCMATNHLGHFLLTNLLTDLLKKSSPSRVVTVSSIVHSWSGQLDFTNFNWDKHQRHKGQFYNYSKLANVLFTRELAQRLQGTGVTANSLHPGSINTDLLNKLPSWIRFPIAVIGYFFFRSPESGAQTSIYCAVSDEIEGTTGRYYSECRLATEGKVAQDDGAARKLWEISEKLTGLVK